MLLAYLVFAMVIRGSGTGASATLCMRGQLVHGYGWFMGMVGSWVWYVAACNMNRSCAWRYLGWDYTGFGR